MLYRSSVAFIAMAAALLTEVVVLQAHDESKYPDMKGQWLRSRVPGVVGQPSYDPAKSEGYAQQAPLTPEYRAIHEASIADQKAGGQGNDPTYLCIPPGMPRLMNLYDPMEIVVTAETTHILIEYIRDSRRIYTDGRDWPTDFWNHPATLAFVLRSRFASSRPSAKRSSCASAGLTLSNAAY